MAYSIYEGHMDKLMKKITKIQNKCKKYGCEFRFEQVGEEFKEVKDLEGNLHNCKFILVEAEGTAMINDWVFVASVEHTEKGNIFSKALTDIEIPEKYRTTDPICEHCNTKHTRKNTFIVMNTQSGEFKQVGKSCLMDFTHGMSAESATWFASLKDVFEEAQEEHISLGGYYETYIPTEEILLYAAETIRKFGYVKSDTWGTPSTKDRTIDFWKVDTGRTFWMPKEYIQDLKDEMARIHFNPNSEEAQKMVKDALAWIKDQDATNDYMHNLKTCCELKFANWNRYGILVSLFPTYNKDLEIQIQKQSKQEAHQEEVETSKHIGSVGDRIQINVQSIKCLTSWENSFNGYTSTTTYLFKIVDDQGNIFTWKTQKWMDEENPPKEIKGTIKAHNEFRNVKQTELTRCKVQGIA